MTEAEVIALIQQQFAILAPKVRIPELPDYGVAGDVMTLNDRIPVWRAADDKTVNTSLETLKALLVNSSDEVLSPTLMGSIFVVTAGLSEDNTNTFNIPALANKQFVLRPAGYLALEAGTEYEMLASGGFKLLPAAPNAGIIVNGMKFEIELIDDSIPVPPGDTTGTVLFTGAVTIPSSQTINGTNHLNKLIQLRPAAVGMITSLPNVDDVPENTVWCFEASLAQYESGIGTTAGQYIYFNGASYQNIYLRPGEYVDVYRGADGWYVWNYDPRILRAGELSWGYAIEADEVALEGGAIARNLYPRFANKIDTVFSASKVTLAQWNLVAAYYYNNAWTTTQPPAGSTYTTVPYPFRGCFADIDANTIRLPDLRDMFIRGLGTDATQRYMLKAGILQLDDYKSHDHHRNNNGITEANMQWPALGGGGDFGGGSRFPINAIRTGLAGGKETRPLNIAMRPKMKV